MEKPTTIIDGSNDHFVNSAGAVIYRDSDRHPMLSVAHNHQTRLISWHESQRGIPVITCKEGNDLAVYCLTIDFGGWADLAVTMPSPFPANVEFGVSDGRFCAEID